MLKVLMFTILSVFTFQFSCAQYDTPTIYFKNGEKLEGYRHSFIGDQVKFLKDKNSKTKIYDFENIDKVVVSFLRRGGIRTYKRFPVVGKKRALTLEVKYEGYVSVFALEKDSPNGGYMYDYFVKKEDEEAVTFLGSDNFLKRGFKKRAMKYFADCNDLVDMILKNKYKIKDLDAIAYVYNEDCI